MAAYERLPEGDVRYYLTADFTVYKPLLYEYARLYIFSSISFRSPTFDVFFQMNKDDTPKLHNIQYIKLHILLTKHTFNTTPFSHHENLHEISSCLLENIPNSHITNLYFSLSFQVSAQVNLGQGLQREIFFLNLEDGYFGCQVNESTDVLQLFEVSRLCDGTPNCFLGSDENFQELKCTSKYLWRLEGVLFRYMSFVEEFRICLTPHRWISRYR